jgi:hypothetical protein
MSFEEFFRDFWWLIFPLFGMVMATMGMFQSERRSNQAMSLIKSYIDQGKEPPAELLKLAAEGSDEQKRNSPQDNRAWSFIVFTALAAGLGTGYYYVQAQDWAFAFLVGAVTMGVLAVGSLILLFIRKS